MISHNMNSEEPNDIDQESLSTETIRLYNDSFLIRIHSFFNHSHLSCQMFIGKDKIEQ